MVLAGAAVFALIAAFGFGALWHCCERRLRRERRQWAEVARRHASSEAEAHALREALDALPVPVWRRRRDRTLVDCNGAYAAALGIDRETALAQNRDLLPASLTVPGNAALSAQKPFSVHITIGGRRRRLELHEARCALGGTVGFALDCSDAELARSELRRQIAAHAAVLEGLSAPVAIFGANRRLDFFNGAFARLWGLDGNWLRSAPTLGDILERLHQSRRFPEYQDFKAFKRERCELFASLLEPRQELMHLPDGRTLQLTVAPHPLGGLTFVYDDVSDRLALECSYNTLTQVQRATLDNLFEGIAVFGGDGRLKLHNPAYRALWGLSDTDVAGEPHIGEIADRTRDLLDDGGDWAALRERMVAQITSQTLASGPLYRRDGSMLQVASVPLPDGEVLLSYLDVSDTARVERALRERNEALEAAGRLKSEFVANVSHDLRTPLNSIIGFAEILHNQYFGPLNPSQREYSRGILASAQQLISLVNDMIDLATIEAGYMELERGPLDIAGLLQGVGNLARERVRAQGLSLEMCCPARIGLVEGDERRLKQALFNLVSNAIRFTPPGGVIRLEAERCEEGVLLRVADSPAGGGATTVHEGRSGESTRRQSSANSGFGLALVRSLIELHGGAVEIETAGAGSRITCRLPAAGRGREAAADAACAEQRHSEPSDSPCRIAA